MRKIAFRNTRLFLLIMAAFFSCQSGAATFTTPTYTITIIINCQEGEIGCDSISYEGVNRKNKKKISLLGRDVMHYCRGNPSDTPIPCHHEGYEFFSGKTKYYVSDQGFLEISKGSKRILYEQGIWDWGYQ